jgi:hypothetical protein
MIPQRSDLTFKHNIKQGRHGWLRLTPAYSVKIVQDALERVGKPQFVLDPFSGTGTTGLVCAERGIPCDLAELNPFLVWLAEAKTHHYTPRSLDAACELARAAATEARQNIGADNLWIPPLNHIERWWLPERLIALASLFHRLQNWRGEAGEIPAVKLAMISFCRAAINWSNATFNHQSMSFREAQPALFRQDERDLILDDFLACIQQIAASARLPLAGGVTVHEGDSRCINTLSPRLYDCVITSPPYPNRISYIREVRPYMYWLGFLKEAREAGELDWQAIGGTWGIATSRLAQWHPGDSHICYEDFEEIIASIRAQSPLLANYVHKYFCDIETHLANLRCVLASGAKIFYIVGNSKFYDTLVPVEQIYMSLLRQLGFRNVSSELLRKRNSKKELYEFAVSAEWG